MSGAAFGDADPEDVWHPDDPVPALVANIIARLAVVEAAARSGARAQRDDGRRRLHAVAADIAHVRRRFHD